MEKNSTSLNPHPAGAHSSVGSLLQPVMVVYFVTWEIMMIVVK